MGFRFDGKDLPVETAYDVLTWVCKKLVLHEPRRIQWMMRAHRCDWLRPTSNGMLQPYQISYNCYVDIDGAARTSLMRAGLILKWLGMSDSSATVTIQFCSSLPLASTPELLQTNSQQGDLQSQEVQPLASSEAEETERPHVLKFSFASDEDKVATECKPISLCFMGEEYPLGGKWCNLLLETCRAIASLNPGQLRRLVANGKVYGVALSPYTMRSGRFIEDAGIWYETYASARRMLRRSKGIMRLAGFDISDVYVTCNPNGKGNSASLDVGKHPLGASPQLDSIALDEEIVEKVKKVILREYPNGTVLNNATVALIEKDIGERLDANYIDRVKRDMFLCGDGTRLYPEMIMDADTLTKMRKMASALLADHGMFAYEVLLSAFAGSIRNIDERRDFVRFLKRFILEGMELTPCYDVYEGLEWTMCFVDRTGKISNDSFRLHKDDIKMRVRNVLLERGDAVSVHEIQAQLPYLSVEVIADVGKNLIPDAVVFDVDGVRHIKLLEAFYLPDDFATALSSFVEETEARMSVVSVKLLGEAFDNLFGDGFRVNYGLEDDFVFKQVVSKSFVGKDHGWNRDMFARNGQGINVVDEFVNLRNGVFHEEEFFDYAHANRGLDNHASLVCQYLRTRCVRLNRTMWISVADFARRGVLDSEALNRVKLFLKEQLGTSPMLHIGLIPEMIIASLPPVTIEECEYSWNAYSLTSVARHFIKDLNVVNDEPSPYYVTAILLPEGINVDRQEIVEYVFDTCKAAGIIPHSADEAFAYLRATQVRMTKTAKLMEKIRAYWSF